MSYDLREISSNFRIYGDFVSATPFGSGHINSTYKVVFNQGGAPVSYIFQKLNTEVFKEPRAVMENVHRVLLHQKEKLTDREDSSRRALSLVLGKDDKFMYMDRFKNYWRAYFFIENTTCYNVMKDVSLAFKVAKTFGEFQKMLVDLPGGRLNDTIPDFHNTPKRYETLEKAIAEDIGDRVKDVQEEIDFLLSRKNLAGKLIGLHKAGKLPERICHNDTKLNNVMMDNDTGEGICIIDLDTVMPGFTLYDFGNLIRTGTSPAEEDERDLSKVTMQMSLFKAIARGYLSEAGGFLTKAEKENLAFSGVLTTLEDAVRFLTDHLQLDPYYKIHREGHNLDRCRTQIALIRSIEEQMDEMNEFVGSSC